MTGRTRPYPEEVRELAIALSEGGLSDGAVARELGVGHTTVRRWRDPEYRLAMNARHKERSDEFRRPCPLCGTLMMSDRHVRGGYRHPSRVCKNCWGAYSRVWTEELVIERIQLWTRIYGVSPSAADWNPSMARALGRFDRADRFDNDDRWPYSFTVQKRFGSWNNALRAAGVPWRPVGFKVSDMLGREAS